MHPCIRVVTRFHIHRVQYPFHHQYPMGTIPMALSITSMLSLQYPSTNSIPTPVISKTAEAIFAATAMALPSSVYNRKQVGTPQGYTIRVGLETTQVSIILQGPCTRLINKQSPASGGSKACNMPISSSYSPNNRAP